MNKIRVAYPVCVFPPYNGGIGNAALNIALALSDKYDITVYTPDYGQKKLKNKIEFPFKVKRLKPFFEFGNAAFLPQLKNELIDFDIVHLHYPFYGGAEFAYLAKKKNPMIKLILHYHMDTAEIGFKGIIFKLYRNYLLPNLLEKSELVTCASLDYIANSNLKDTFKNNKDKFKEILFGVDLGKFKPMSVAKISQKNILFVGGLDNAHNFKGLEYLIKSMAILKYDMKAEHDFTFTIVGSGNLENYYHELVKQKGLSQNVIFLGDVDDVELNRQYNLADLLVLPSINSNEAFGLVLLEALACNTPVIASDLPGVRSVFRNNIDGLLSLPKDTKNLAKKIYEILFSRDNKKFGMNSRVYIEDNYTWERVVSKLDKIYKEILSQ